MVANETGTSREDARAALDLHDQRPSLAKVPPCPQRVCHLSLQASLLWRGEPPKFDGVGPTSLWITWTPPPWPKVRIDGYRVLQQTGGQGKYEEAVRFTPRTYSKITGLSPGATYKFKVHAKAGQDHLSAYPP